MMKNVTNLFFALDNTCPWLIESRQVKVHKMQREKILLQTDQKFLLATYQDVIHVLQIDLPWMPSCLLQIIADYTFPTLAHSYLLANSNNVVALVIHPRKLIDNAVHLLLHLGQVKEYIRTLTAELEWFSLDRVNVFSLADVPRTLLEEILNTLVPRGDEYAVGTFTWKKLQPLPPLILPQVEHYHKKMAVELTRIAGRCGGMAFGGFVRDVIALGKDKFNDLDLFFPRAEHLRKFIRQCEEEKLVLSSSGESIRDFLAGLGDKYRNSRTLSTYIGYRRGPFQEIDLVLPLREGDMQPPPCNDYEINALVSNDGETCRCVHQLRTTEGVKSVEQIVSEYKSGMLYLLPEFAEKMIAAVAIAAATAEEGKENDGSTSEKRKTSAQSVLWSFSR